MSTTKTRPKNKGGRPAKKLTDEQIAQVEALGAVLSIEQIADYFGIGKTTFYSVMGRQPEVRERYKRGKAKAIGTIAQGLLQQARDGNTTAAMFYLKTQAGWRETQQIDHTTGGESIVPKVVKRVVIDPGKDANSDSEMGAPPA